MKIISVRDDKAHEAAVARIEELWDAKPGTPEFEELDVLATLVDSYEEKKLLMDPPSPMEVIQARMDDLGLTRKALEPCIGHKGRVSEILNRKRPLTLPMIRKLSALLRVPSDLLTPEYPLDNS
ncbi:type II toxin-antitoxin system HigA family antitoxin [Thermodesulfobacteriota bacterium]